MSIKAKIALAAVAVGVLAMSAAAQNTTPPTFTCPASRNNPAPSGSPVARYGALRVEGNKIVSSITNQPVQLRGPSLFWSHDGDGSPFYTAGVVNWVRSDWQATVIRPAMAVERDWYGAQGYINNQQSGQRGNFDRLLTVVDAAIAAGIYVIVDWHTYVGEATTEYAIPFFEAIARCYGGVPNIIYEIYNEPNGRSGTPQSTPSGIPDNTGSSWTGVVPGMPGSRSVRQHMVQVTNAIRAIDPTNIIFIGTPNWGQRPDIATADPIPGTNLVYTAHFYAGEPSTNLVHHASLRDRIMVAMNRGFPVFISEFGITDASGSGTVSEERGDLWLQFLDANQIGWAMWALSTGGQTSRMLSGGASPSGGWSDGNLTQSGRFARSRLRSNPSTTNPFRILTFAVEGQGSAGTAGDRYVFDPGSSEAVTIFAEAAPGWRFVEWRGNVPNPSQSMQPISVTSSMTLTAVFADESGPWDGKWCRPATTPTTGEDNVCVAADVLNWDETRCSFTTQQSCHQDLWVKYYCPTVNGRCREQSSQWVLEAPGSCLLVQSDCVTRCNELGPPEEDDPPNTPRCIWDPSSSVRHGLANRNRAWTPSVSGNRFTLSGPSAARVTLYDMRGRQVRTFAYNGSGQLTISASTAGISRGNYIVAVRELSSGREVYRGRVALVR